MARRYHNDWRSDSRLRVSCIVVQAAWSCWLVWNLRRWRRWNLHLGLETCFTNRSRLKNWIIFLAHLRRLNELEARKVSLKPNQKSCSSTRSTRAAKIQNHNKIFYFDFYFTPKLSLKQWLVTLIRRWMQWTDAIAGCPNQEWYTVISD